jgi:2-polyprenyl-3-methyl-5-hydroxy-6-metoxy-1,4-benzoquinol methylase
MAKFPMWMKRLIKSDGIAQHSESIALFPPPGSPVEEFHKPLPHSTVPRVIIRHLLTFLKLNARRQLTPGIALFGYNIFKDTCPGYPRFRSLYALDYAIKLKPISVLDVGSGGGYHALAFANAGSNVLCVDYGSSVYAKQSDVHNLNVVHVDFNQFNPPAKFDLVWASHILEHQQNVGNFIQKLIECCTEDGHICITVPDPHRPLLGGHLTLWSPGLLAYNIALCGIDVSDSKLVRGTKEFSIFFKPKKVKLPALTYDNGDIALLEKFLPATCREGGDAGIEW